MSLPTDRILHQIRKTIRDHAMIASGDHILAGVSGGPDSMALVRVLTALAAEYGLTVSLAHLNHGLRGDNANRDEEFVRAFAHQNQLPLTVETRDIRVLATSERLSLEEAGRNARYDFFQRTAASQNCNRIALGHHRDDHVELVLMNLIRGAGLRGLRGIAPVRQGGIIRPLMALSKPQILAFLKDLNQDFVIDESNRDTTFLRNRVRQDLLPFMEARFNPGIRTGLDRLSQILALEDDYMDARTEEAFCRLCPESSRGPASHGISLPTKGLGECHPALARRLIRHALEFVKKDLRRITHTHILDILRLAAAGEPGKHLDLPGQIRVYKQRGLIRIKKESRPLRELGSRPGENRSGQG